MYRVLTLGLTLLFFPGCGSRDLSAEGGAAAQQAPNRQERVRRLLEVLAADSLEGRRTGSRGAEIAARFLASELALSGVEPAGLEGYFQEVVLVRDEDGSGRLGLLPPGTDPASIDPARLVRDRNVVGIVTGADPVLREEIIVIGAHYDHLGIGTPLNGDSIYNGADDDGSGTVAVLEIARALAGVRPPARSVLVLLTTAEEMGMLGTSRWVREPTVSLDRLVADLQIEMIGRPDSLAGGRGTGWLTGYERSTMGDLLREAGSPIVPDPRPEQGFFARSDNIVFARAGIPAHTLSSFGLHADYHRPSDEVERVDFVHMAALIDAAEVMVWELARGPRPQWHPGGRPEGEREC